MNGCNEGIGLIIIYMLQCTIIKWREQGFCLPFAYVQAHSLLFIINFHVLWVHSIIIISMYVDLYFICIDLNNRTSGNTVLIILLPLITFATILIILLALTLCAIKGICVTKNTSEENNYNQQLNYIESHKGIRMEENAAYSHIILHASKRSWSAHGQTWAHQHVATVVHAKKIDY